MPESLLTPRDNDKGISAVFEKLKNNDCTIRGPVDVPKFISEEDLRSLTLTSGASPRLVNCFGDRRDNFQKLGRSLGNIKNSPEITMRGIAANPVGIMAAKLFGEQPQKAKGYKSV